MPAWSMPGRRSVSYPCIRRRRISASMSDARTRAAEMQAAVTLGGGSTMQYAGFGDVASTSK